MSGVRALHHVNIQGLATLVDACRAFYTDVLGLREGYRPPFRRRGYWLYAGEAAVVHLSESEPRPSGAALDHVAFECEGLDEMIARLDARGVAYELDRVPDSGEAQIFLRDPAGVGVELNFAQ